MRDLRCYDGEDHGHGDRDEELPEYTVDVQGLVRENSLGGVGEMAPRYEKVARGRGREGVEGGGWRG